MPSWFVRLIGRIRSRLRARHDLESDMAEEIRLHLEHRISEFVATGLTPEEATRAARRQFGSIESVKEACRDGRRRGLPFDTVWQDVRYAARSLTRDRSFSLAAVSTLTLGIGLVTAFFAVFSATLLKPWPLPDPDTLVRATRGVSPAAYRHLRDHTTSIDLVATETCPSFIEGQAKGIGFRCVSGNYFDVLRVPLALGRGFRPEEDVAGAPVPVVVIGHGLWRERFSSSPDAIGRTIRLNEIPFQIVGVAARGATDEPGTSLPRLWIPMAAFPLVMADNEHNRRFLVDPERCCVDLSGRLRPSQSRESVSAELTVLHRAFRGASDTRAISITGTSAIHQPWEDSAVAVSALALAAVVLVLVVACANVGNLQLARASRRRHELQIRLSLGATRSRILRQLLTEGVVLAAVATASSLLLASVPALVVRWLSDRGRIDSVGIDLTPDWRVALLSVLLASVVILLTGLSPASRSTRRLFVGDRSTTAPIRARSWFVVIQVALSAVLVVGASLLGRGLLRAGSLDPGFDAEGVARVSVRLPSYQARDSRIAAIHTAMRDAVATPDRLLSAEAGVLRHLDRVSVTTPFEMHVDRVMSLGISPGYLELLGVPLREGRLLGDGDEPGAVVVNESFATRLSPGRSALGTTFVPGRVTAVSGAGSAPPDVSGTPRVVVGVVSDTWPEGAAPGAAVAPVFFERGGGDRLYLSNEAAVLDRARAAARVIDPEAGVAFTPMAQSFEAALADMRIGVVLAGVLGFVALAMASTGIFGVFALVAEEQRREVGIRLALGARRRAIVQLMLHRAGRALTVGLLLGVGIALIVAPLLRRYLAGLGPYDPAAFAAAALVLLISAVSATAIPIRRALRVDPALTLRGD